MALKRRAILVEASNLNGHPDLPGARVDVDNWRQHLVSNWGGAWEDAEIQVKHKPTWQDLCITLALASYDDYVFLAFSGHGGHVRDKDLDESLVQLNESESVPVRLLNPNSARCTIVIDACRQVVSRDMFIENAFLAARMEKAAADRAAYRELFDRAVSASERGAIFMYACAVGEAAGESARSGGFYSQYLVQCSKDWHDNTPSGENSAFSAWNAHTCAANRTTQRRPQQHPQYDGGRRNMHFPMAIRP
jgi:hypothetical protein